MTSDEAISELDRVLDYFKTKRPHLTVGEIERDLYDAKKNAIQEPIINKLVRDKYLLEREVKRANEVVPQMEYILSLEGIIFEGYAQQKQNDNRARFISKFELAALIFGGLTAGAYYAIQLLTMFCDYVFYHFH